MPRGAKPFLAHRHDGTRWFVRTQALGVICIAVDPSPVRAFRQQHASSRQRPIDALFPGSSRIRGVARQSHAPLCPGQGIEPDTDRNAGTVPAVSDPTALDTRMKNSRAADPAESVGTLTALSDTHAKPSRERIRYEPNKAGRGCAYRSRTAHRSARAEGRSAPGTDCRSDADSPQPRRDSSTGSLHFAIPWFLVMPPGPCSALHRPRDSIRRFRGNGSPALHRAIRGGGIAPRMGQSGALAAAGALERSEPMPKTSLATDAEFRRCVDRTRTFRCPARSEFPTDEPAGRGNWVIETLVSGPDRAHGWAIVCGHPHRDSSRPGRGGRHECRMRPLHHGIRRVDAPGLPARPQAPWHGCSRGGLDWAG